VVWNNSKCVSCRSFAIPLHPEISGPTRTFTTLPAPCSQPTCYPLYGSARIMNCLRVPSVEGGPDTCSRREFSKTLSTLDTQQPNSTASLEEQRVCGSRPGRTEPGYNSERAPE